MCYIFVPAALNTSELLEACTSCSKKKKLPLHTHT